LVRRSHGGKLRSCSLPMDSAPSDDAAPSKSRYSSGVPVDVPHAHYRQKALAISRDSVAARSPRDTRRLLTVARSTVARTRWRYRRPSPRFRRRRDAPSAPLLRGGRRTLSMWPSRRRSGDLPHPYFFPRASLPLARRSAGTHSARHKRRHSPSNPLVCT
jgi:hypothetical protein